MRRLVTLLLIVPLASAAWLEDPAGDAAVQGLPWGPPSADVTFLEIEESPEAFRLRAGVVDGGAGEPSNVRVLHQVHFAHADTSFRLDVSGYLGINTGSGTGYLPAGSVLYQRGDTAWTTLADLEPEPRSDPDGWATVIPRALLADGDGMEPAAGRTISSWWVESRYGDDVVDRMPDTGTGDPWPVEYGLLQTGHVRLHDERPMRSSNGQATTYRHDMALIHDGASATSYALRTSGIPDGWQVVGLPDTVEVGPRSQTTMGFGVAVPFRHEHGARQTLIIEAMDTNSTAVGRLEVGVVYPAIPQPAGHHPTLWLHAMEGTMGDVNDALAGVLQPMSGQHRSDVMIMNAVEEDDRAKRGPVEGRTGAQGILEIDPSESSYVWSVRLDPSLDIDLVVNASKTGAYAFEVQSPLTDLTDATLEGNITLQAPDGARTVLATLQEAGPITVQSGTRSTLEGAIDPAAPRTHPFVLGSQMWLHLRIDSTRTASPQGDPAPPALVPGGWIRLPLDDHHDALEGVGVVEDSGPPDAEPGRGRGTPLGTGFLLAPLLGALWHRRR